MKVLVTGATGQLGYDVVKELNMRGHIAVGVGSTQMDITNRRQVEQIIQVEAPDAVIHCAAYTAVDKAEEDEIRCREVNAMGTGYIAEICKAFSIKMMYISTDYVFDGMGTRAWEPCDQIVAPLNVYGQTKYEGELAVQKYLNQYFIVRIAWVFGINGNNFVKTMLRLGKERGAVSVVNDQIGSPTYTADLAVLLCDMIESEQYGIYHATNEGFCSWYDFACEIFQAAGMEVQVTPVKATEFPAKAKRPYNSRMNKDKLVENGFHRLPGWQDAVDRYVQNLVQQS